ncbi:POLO box duplicated region [cyanobiont of Ornithocercus magnificus]|nr:POLO box duplicated region [cyanobiont of Ornithocercus magnificus]
MTTFGVDKALWVPSVGANTNILLEQRQQAWPEWRLPTSLTRPKADDDLVYPSWFRGNWQVESTDVNEPSQPVLKHHARFLSDYRGRILGDRVFNATSVGRALLGDQLVRVKNDPFSANRQLAELKGDLRMETSVIGRYQADPEENTFLTDELVLQILHSSGTPRLSQIETLSRYEQCIGDNGEPWICAEQWQARYLGPERILRRSAISTNHYYLCLKPLPETVP